MREIDPLDIVETIREGLIVLEPDLTVRFANRSFCRIFAVAPAETVGRKLYELGNGQWNIPALRTLLETTIADCGKLENFEVEHVFPSIGQRVMMLNARKVYRPGNNILLAIEDVTERVRLERERAAAYERIGVLLQEVNHRIKNSLQIIASIIRLEARNYKGEKGKAALERVSNRVAALGHLYAKLAQADTVETVDAVTYFNELCNDLIASVQEQGKRIVLKADIESERLATDRAIPLGLVVNELVTNAVRYAFQGQTHGTVSVTLKRRRGELNLTVADDGIGIDLQRADSGLGGRLVEAFAQQLGGQIERESGSRGTTVRLKLPSLGDS